MKITYIHQHYPRLPSEGGLGRPWQFARRLADDGHEVTLIAGGSEARRTTVNGVRIIHVRARYATEFGVLRRIGIFLLFMAKATWISTRTRADVVIASSTPLTVAVPGILASTVNRSRFVFEVRDLWPSVPIELGVLNNPFLQLLAKLLERVAYWRADTVIALSEGMARGVRRVNKRVPVAVVPNASDFDLFPANAFERDKTRTALGWGQSETVLVYAGNFGPSYRLPWVVDLAGELRNHGVRVVLYGSGGTLPTLKQQASSKGLDAASLFPGRMRRQDLANAIAAADATISSLLDHESLEPNSLNKVFESMAARKPVFFNHGGWLSELLTSHGAGWRLDNDPVIAARQVVEVSKATDTLRLAGEKSARLGRERFDRDKVYSDFSAAVLG